VSLPAAALIVAAAVSMAITLMLLNRRRAPDGSYFHDSDRAAGVFAVLGTGFAVLLGFVIFLAFDSYRGAKQDGEREATAVAQEFSDAGLFDTASRALVRGDLVCYGRAVSEREWPAMERGEARDSAVERWRLRLDRAVDGVTVAGARQSAGFDAVLRQSADREQARESRLLEARRFLPPIVWFLLILGFVLVVGYVLLWADPGERAFVQAALIGAVTAVLSSGLLLIYVLDTPYGSHSGSIEPVDMRNAVAAMQSQLPRRGALPCDSSGRPVAVSGA
jgi:hypothetical protein